MSVYVCGLKINVLVAEQSCMSKMSKGDLNIQMSLYEAPYLFAVNNKYKLCVFI